MRQPLFKAFGYFVIVDVYAPWIVAFAYPVFMILMIHQAESIAITVLLLFVTICIMYSAVNRDIPWGFNYLRLN